MQLIEPSVELIDEKNQLIKIEKIGRICYKSESDYTRETAINFIKGLIKRGHMSVLEHAVFVFEGAYYRNKPFSQGTYVFDLESKLSRKLTSCNLRSIIENNYYELQDALLKVYPELCSIFNMAEIEKLDKHTIKVVDPKDIQPLLPEEVSAHLHTTFKFVTDRGVTHEMVRHRIASFTQESTRYCNYSKDKFNNQIKCIIPANYSEWDTLNRFEYEKSLERAESAYMKMTQNGATAQEARGVLPTNLATTIVMTANHEEWEHFFDLRSRGKTGSPHPNMKEVASKAEEIYKHTYSDLKVIRFLNIKERTISDSRQ